MLYSVEGGTIPRSLFSTQVDNDENDLIITNSCCIGNRMPVLPKIIARHLAKCCKTTPRYILPFQNYQ